MCTCNIFEDHKAAWFQSHCSQLKECTDRNLISSRSPCFGPRPDLNPKLPSASRNAFTFRQMPKMHCSTGLGAAGQLSSLLCQHATLGGTCAAKQKPPSKCQHQARAKSKLLLRPNAELRQCVDETLSAAFAFWDPVSFDAKSDACSAWTHLWSHEAA